MRHKKIILVGLLILILIFVGGCTNFDNPIGKYPGSSCSLQNGCVTGLYCAKAQHEITGRCEFEFCPLDDKGGAEQGKRYKCNDNTYGCVITKVRTIKEECNKILNAPPYYNCIDGKCISEHETRARKEIRGSFESDFTVVNVEYGVCILEDADYITNGRCFYI